MQKVGNQAVVIGASMAGLLAARVLSEAYERVTVLERDALPSLGQNRKGVPQGRHAHGILPRGMEVLDELFPGLGRRLSDGGAHVIDNPGDMRFFVSGHQLLRRPTGTPVVLLSRPFLEGHVREEVRSLPNVEFLEDCDAVDLVATEDRGRVTGVLLQHPKGSITRVLDAALVVDATGRAGRSRGWLESLGYPPPYEERVRIGVGYASCELRRRPEALDGDKFVLVGPEAGRPTGMALFAIEGERWILTLFGYDSQRPPADSEGFWAFAATVAPGDVFDALHDAERVGPIVTHRLDSNLRRRYERLRRFPHGLLVVGDAICSFNPIYGQGMTVAALEAEALRRCLKGGEHRLALRFFSAAAKAVDHAWKMTTGADLALPEVEGRRTLEVRLVNAYMARLFCAAERDPAVAAAFVRVAGMLQPLPSLLRPGLVLRVLWASRLGSPAVAGDSRPRSVDGDDVQLSVP